MQKILTLAPAIRAAEYYGFLPFESLGTNREIHEKKPEKAPKNVGEIATVRSEEKSLFSAAKMFARYNASGKKPRFLWRKASGKDADTANLELHVLNVPTGMAEALLITLSHAIAEDAGITDRVLRINSIGNADSSGRYVRDIGIFLRKHLEQIPSALRARSALDPLGTLLKLIEKTSPIIGTAPQAMEYLNEDERKHLWDVLEYLEAAELYYELSGHVIGSRDCWTHTLFELVSIDRENGTTESLARGGRYDTLASRFTGTPTHATMLALSCSPKGAATAKRQIPSTIYFAHLGLEARRRSLLVLESLRRAGIPVGQSLTFEQLGDQMRIAKEQRVPYIIIMGHKEAMEGTVLVRDTYTNMQESIALPELPTYLRKNKMIRA